MAKQFQRINDDIKIDFKVPTIIKETMEEAEELDRNGDTEYTPVADILDVLCKAAVTNGHMTEAQWETILNRYPVI